jgi:hypothetical protein
MGARGLVDVIARVIVDPDGRVVFADRVALDLYDVSDVDIVGRPMSEVAGELWLGSTAPDAVVRHIGEHGAWTAHLTHRTRAGLLPVVITARQVQDRHPGGAALHLSIEVEEGAAAEGWIGAVRSEVGALIGTQRFPAILSLVGWLLAARTPEEVGAAVCGTVVDTMDAVAGHLTLRDIDGSVTFVTVVGYSAETMRDWGTIDLSLDTPIREAIVDGRAVYVHDRGERDERYPALREVDEPTQALCAVPLSVGGRILGSIGFSFREPMAFHDADRALLAVAAHITALALQHTGAHAARRPLPSVETTVLQFTWTERVDLALMRATLRPQIAALGCDPTDAVLCATELVTNAAEHGAFPVHARLELRCDTVRGDSVRIEVSDAEQRLPKLRTPGPEGGFGLRIVQSVAERWGTAPTDWGKTTWAELLLR